MTERPLATSRRQTQLEDRVLNEAYYLIQLAVTLKGEIHNPAVTLSHCLTAINTVPTRDNLLQQFQRDTHPRPPCRWCGQDIYDHADDCMVNPKEP